MGCVVEYKKYVRGMGFNTSKTHPKQKMYNKLRFDCDSTPHCLHAEMHALIPLEDMDIDWAKVKVFTYRKAKGNPNKAALARPCPSCMAYMKDLGIKHIYYTTSESFAHEILST